MRKKMFTAAMALMITALPAAAYAAEPGITAQQLFEDAAVYLAQADQVQMKFTTDNAGALSLASEGGPSSSFGGAVKGGGEIIRNSNPLRVYMKGDLTMGMMGISYKAGGELYMMESENGENMDLYATMNVGPEAIGWMHDSTPAADMWSDFGVSSEDEFEKILTELFQEELPELPFEWTVEETESSYTVSYNKNGAELYRELEKFVEEQGGDMELTDEERELVNEVMSCIMIDATAVFDKETHALESAKLDLSSSDAAGLGEKLTELMQEEFSAEAEEILESVEDMLIGLELESAYAEMTCSYENVPEITVPQEVIDQAFETEENLETEAETIAPETVMTEEMSEI